jgi:hypothetical protein
MPTNTDRGHIHHVPIVGRPPAEGEVRHTVIFDSKTGRKIGSSPHVHVEQTSYDEVDGVVTTTLKFTLKGD